MFLGNKDADLNGTKAYFRGTKVLAAAIKQVSLSLSLPLPLSLALSVSLARALSLSLSLSLSLAAREHIGNSTLFLALQPK